VTNEQQLRAAWDAGSAHMLGSSIAFKQTHPCFNVWFAMQPKQVCRWTLIDPHGICTGGDSIRYKTECGILWGVKRQLSDVEYCPKCSRQIEEIEVQP